MMHRVFNVSKDPFIFDVSHQAYAHKLLTGRWDDFDTLRQFNGLCGYTKPSESEDDYFVAGHSSTSISLGVGAAKAIALKGAEVILHPSLTDTCDRDVERAMVKATAAQQQCYYIDVNAGGEQGCGL